MRLAACLCFVLFASFVVSPTPSSAAEKQPNIIIFLADDEGWGELGCQGNKQIPTPHIDSIAAAGVRFTQGYVAATYCSPSRAGLMTGRYPTRFGHEFNPGGNREIAGLSLDETTIADRLKAAGYATACVGKWHLGQAPHFYPMKRGFDEFYGTLNNTPFFHPTNFIDSRKGDQIQEITDDTFYTTDAYAERACDWIEKNKKGPFFLYLPFNAQHAPLQAPQKYLDRFANIEDEKRRTFAAMMSAQDDAVGRVLAKVKEIGAEDNTLVWYLTDNGGPTASTTSQNGPLRGFKATTWEGGTRVPFMVKWPGKIPAGKTYENPIIQLDILPTCIAATNVVRRSAAGPEAPADAAPAKPLDGVNLLPYLTGEKSDRPHETLYWRFGPQWAVRHGDFKLVKGNGQETLGLYNLAADIGESKDLAAAQPEKAAELKALYDKWNAEQSEPKWRPNPNAKKKGNKKAKAAAKAKAA
jgi:arylsulfatase A-like enzyme